MTARTQTTFVYCPKSGPRWIEGAAPRFGILTPTIVWNNCSAHVIGVTLSVSAAVAGAYFRPMAIEVARQLAMSLRGVAWDAQGVIHLCVAERDARTAFTHLAALNSGTEMDLGNPNTAPLLCACPWPVTNVDITEFTSYILPAEGDDSPPRTEVVLLRNLSEEGYPTPVVVVAKEWTLAKVWGVEESVVESAAE